MNHRLVHISLNFSLLVLGLMVTFKSSAEVFHWPKLCSEQTLTIENKSPHEQIFWLQHWDKVLTAEMDYLVPANSKMQIILQNDLANTAQDYSLLSLNEANDQFSFYSNCSPKETIPVSSLEGGVIYYKINSTKNYQLQLKNLFHGVNTFYIEDLSFLKKSKRVEIDVNAKENITLPLKADRSSTWIKIWAKERFHTALFTSTQAIKPTYTEVQRSVASTDAKYFLMAPSDNIGDQFVIKITDPTMIVKAREQITNPKLQKIVFAKIALGSQGYNRNFIKKEKSFWSWSVTEVTNISDFGSTACNGFPQLVEDRAQNWVNTLGRICFWSYRIKKELTPFEVMNP